MGLVYRVRVGLGRGAGAVVVIAATTSGTQDSLMGAVHDERPLYSGLLVSEKLNQEHDKPP